MPFVELRKFRATILFAGAALAMVCCILIGPSTALAQAPMPSFAGAAKAPSAQTAEPDPTNPEALQRTIAVLDDPVKRAEVLGILRTLLAAETRAQPQETPDTILQQGLNEIDERLASFSDVVVALPNSFNQVPALMSWLRYQVSDGWRRDFWKNELFRLIGILAFGAVGLMVTRIALRSRVRRSLKIEEAQPTLDLSRRIGRVALKAAPQVAFVVVALIVTGLLPGDFLAHDIARTVVWGMLLYILLLSILRLLFAPRTASFRLLPVDDDVAWQAFRRLRLLAALLIWGGVLLQAARVLGMPWTLHSFLTHLINASLVLLAIVTVQQWRKPIARGIANLGGDRNGTLVRFLTPRRLAAAWHILAIAWIVTAYLLWALQIPGGFFLFARGTVTTIIAFIVVRLLLMRIEVEQEVVSDGPDQPRAKADSEHDPGIIQKLGPVARTAIAFGIRLVALLIVAEGWGLGLREWLFTGGGTQFLQAGTKLAITAAAALIAWQLTATTLTRSIEARDQAGNLRYSARTRTLLQILRNLLLAAIVLIVLLLFLSEIGIDAGPLLAGAGVIGLAIGFGSQKLVQDVIGGSFILLGDTIRVGDVVDIGGKSGVVEGLSIRTVTLRSYNGDVHTVPYSSIEVITNLTRDFSYAVFEIGIDYDTDVDRAMEIMREVADKMRSTWPWYRKMVQPLEIAGLDQFGDSAIIIKGRIKTRPGDQWEITREYQRRLRQRFAELGISFPYPARQIVIRDAGELSRSQNDPTMQAAAAAAAGGA